MSWVQRDKTLQETVTFTNKKKTAYNYSDPGGTSEKLNNLKPLFSRIEELYISKEVKENALGLRGQIMPTINNFPCNCCAFSLLELTICIEKAFYRNERYLFVT